MKSPTKSKGKPGEFDPYPHGIVQFVEAFNLAVFAQYNATPQDGQLWGLFAKGDVS